MEQFYRALPPVTRTWATLACVTTLAAWMGMVSPFSLYFNARLIASGQVWRVFTPFVYFATTSALDVALHLFFVVHYCRTLEESHYAGRVADMLYMILFGAVLIMAAASVLGLLFLGDALSFMTVYIWARRNEHVPMNLFGMFRFNAPFLPWILMGFSALLGQSLIPDLIGIAVGHLYFFFTDIYPVTSGRHFLATPLFLKRIVGEAPAYNAHDPDPDQAAANPGGYAFG